ncbi:conserved hypothetical protein [Aeromicrobium sp. 9AM]|nr:conserved hypothetical protein [Aeromicrobium sp. 9AM]
MTRMSASTTPKVLSTPNQHIASRFSFGVNEYLISDIGSSRSATKWLERQFAWSKLGDTKGDAVINWFPHLRDQPAKAWTNHQNEDHTAYAYGRDLCAYTLAMKVATRRQVREVMADVWSNLFYIPMGEGRSFPWRYSFDAMIRSRSLGSFRSLLRGAVLHPAMSGWLNNSSNTKYGINENLGRELLELFTVGRPAGYDEDDVKNSARILTGFRVKMFDSFAASYDPELHYVGRIRVLGFSHANSSKDGRTAVNAYLDYLARHPATATRIARRLCVRFVSDTPSSSIVSAVAKAYRASDTDIKATLRALVRHPDFQASKRKKVRTPIEDVVNAARVLGLRPTGCSTERSFPLHLLWMAEGVGQSQFGWPRPDGFPETSAIWASPARVLRSWNNHYDLAGNWWRSAEVYLPARKDQLPSAWPRALGQLVEHQARMLLGRGAPSDLQSAVASALNLPLAYEFNSAAEVTEWTWALIRGAVLNLPEGMLR